MNFPPNPVKRTERGPRKRPQEECLRVTSAHTIRQFPLVAVVVFVVAFPCLAGGSCKET